MIEQKSIIVLFKFKKFDVIAMWLCAETAVQPSPHLSGTLVKTYVCNKNNMTKWNKQQLYQIAIHSYKILEKYTRMVKYYKKSIKIPKVK